MAGLPWIKVWTVVGRHPKVQRLERELGLRDALGLVVRLWCWTADYHPDGEIPEHDADGMVADAIGDLAIDAAHVTHRNARVTQALVTAGFLDPVPGGYRVHDWQDMQTVHVEVEEKRKAQARERQARFRSKRSVTGERDVTRDVTRDSVTEMEREKEKERETTTPAAEDEPVLLPTLPPKPASPFVTFLRETYPDIRDPWASESAWLKAFPGVDLLAEALKARAWETSDPKRQKTSHGRFLNGWFGRAQDDASKRSAAPQRRTMGEPGKGSDFDDAPVWGRKTNAIHS
jgi:hypothetical protein